MKQKPSYLLYLKFDLHISFFHICKFHSQYSETFSIIPSPADINKRIPPLTAGLTPRIQAKLPPSSNPRPDSGDTAERALDTDNAVMQEEEHHSSVTLGSCHQPRWATIWAAQLECHQNMVPKYKATLSGKWHPVYYIYQIMTKCNVMIIL